MLHQSKTSFFLIMLVTMIGIISGTTLSATDPSQIRLGPGDAVRLYIYDGLYQASSDKFISTFHDQEFVIDGFGQIYLFSIGKVKVSGMTTDEISKVLAEEFRPFSKDPRINVVPLIRLFFRGGFGKAGLYRLDPSISFWQAMEEVGGVTALSRLEDLFVLREDEIIYPDFYDAFYRASSLAELGLQSGDEISAPRMNRLTFNTVIRYLQFGMSLLIFYFSVLNYNDNR